MIPVPSGVRIWIATGHTDMWRGMRGLALQIQQSFGRDPFVGDLYIFHGRRGDLCKVIWHDGVGIRFMPSGLSEAGLPGHRHLTGLLPFPHRSLPACSRASTGVIRRQHDARQSPDK